MELNILKECITNKSLTDDFFIFKINLGKDDGSDFLANQYVKEISNLLSCTKIEYIDSLDSFVSPYNNMFNINPEGDNSLKVYKCDSLDIIDTKLNFSHKLIIITGKISDDARSTYSYNIVEMPKLESWMVKDYAIAYGKGIDKEDIEYLCTVCDYNIYRIANELDKLKNFGLGQRKYFFKQMRSEGAFDDLTQFNIFNFTNALQARDLKSIKDILSSTLDIEPISLLSILYQNFRKMIMVWLDNNPTQESTGLKSNQIWAIRNIPRNYNKDQLIKIFKFLTSLDSELKQGNLPNNYLTDYIICKILSI